MSTRKRTPPYVLPGLYRVFYSSRYFLTSCLPLDEEGTINLPMSLSGRTGLLVADLFILVVIMTTIQYIIYGIILPESPSVYRLSKQGQTFILISLGTMYWTVLDSWGPSRSLRNTAIVRTASDGDTSVSVNKIAIRSFLKVITLPIWPLAFVYMLFSNSNRIFYDQILDSKRIFVR